MAFGDSLRMTRPKRKAYYFSRVLNMEYKKEGNVEEFLESQFTVNYDDGTFGFLFYKERGAIWKPLNEELPSKKKSKKNSLGYSKSQYQFVTTDEAVGLGGQQAQPGFWAAFNPTAGQVGAGNQPTQAPPPAVEEAPIELVNEEDAMEAQDMLFQMQQEAMLDAEMAVLEAEEYL